MNAALERLQATTLSALARHISAGPAALLDFPSHDNAGDSLIYVGERAYLRQLGVHLTYVADHMRFDPRELRHRVPAGPLLLHGGGNLGDRWTEHQGLRHLVVREFPDRKIIQLPQSVNFTDHGELQRAHRLWRTHPDLTLLIRDTGSLRRALDGFPDNRVEFCPDMALGAGPRQRPVPPSHDIVLLRRTDSEAALAGEFRFPSHWSVLRADWGHTGHRKLHWDAARVPGALARRAPALRAGLYPAIRRGYEAQANLNVRAATRLLSRARVVITDRLHAMVLAQLMGIPVVALDNVNRKVSATWHDYLAELGSARLAADPDEAIEIAAHLLRHSPPAR